MPPWLVRAAVEVAGTVPKTHSGLLGQRGEADRRGGAAGPHRPGSVGPGQRREAGQGRQQVGKGRAGHRGCFLAARRAAGQPIGDRAPRPPCREEAPRRPATFPGSPRDRLPGWSVASPVRWLRWSHVLRGKHDGQQHCRRCPSQSWSRLPIGGSARPFVRPLVDGHGGRVSLAQPRPHRSVAGTSFPTARKSACETGRSWGKVRLSRHRVSSSLAGCSRPTLIGGLWHFWGSGFGGSSVSAAELAPRQPVSLPNGIASLQGRS